MTRPSLTPHEDAFHQTIKQRVPPKNPLQEAVFPIVEMTALEYARAMDRGQGPDQCVSICVSVCCSIIATLAWSSTATTKGEDEKAAREMMAYIVAKIMANVGGNPLSSISVDIDQTRPVRA